MIKNLKLKHFFTKPKKNPYDLLARMPIPYEPMRRNRYVLRVLNDDTEISEWFVNTVYGLSVAGEYSREEFWITFRDLIIPNTNPINLITDLNGDMVNMELEMLDPTGVVVGKWELCDCVVSATDLTAIPYMDDPSNCDGVRVLFTPRYTVKIY
jgi:hypothetical protein